MSSSSHERLPLLLMAAVSGVALISALSLETWDIFGPGPGLFPIGVSGVCLLLSLTLVAMPGLGNRSPHAHPVEDPESAGDAPLAPAEKRTFGSTVAALLLLAIAPILGMGFLATTMMVALLITWWGERQPLRKTMLFAVISGLVGVLAFGWLLSVDIPESPLEVSILRIVR